MTQARVASSNSRAECLRRSSLGMTRSSPTRIGSDRGATASRHLNMDRCDIFFSATSGTEVPLCETLARFVGLPRLTTSLVEHQAFTGELDRCSLVQVSSLARWSAASFAACSATCLCGLGVHIITSLTSGELQRLSFNNLRELLDFEHQRYPGLSHLLSSPIFRLGVSYRERSVLPGIYPTG